MDKQREMFEAWYLDYCKPGTGDWFARDFFNADEYVMSHTQTAWDAWQAAIAAQWQPIETAPKDGTKVLLLTSYGIVEGFYKKLVVGDGYWDQRVAFGMGEFGDLKPPTHWMPLPPEPTK